WQATAQSATAQSAPAQLTKVNNGIRVNVAGRQIELQVAKDAAFCLSLNGPEIKSVFIDDDNSAPARYTVISAAPSYGIKTAYGKLMINTDTRVWSLYDAAGRVLVGDGAYSATDSSIEVTQTADGLMYGSGNRTSKALEKNQSASSVWNGAAGIPYFWNSTGYSEFAVSGNSDAPATWDRPNGKVTWKFSGKAANVYLWPAKTIYDGARGYAHLTGRPKLPPRWAFGY